MINVFGGIGFGMNYKRKLLVSGYFEEVVSFLFSPDAYIYILKIIEKVLIRFISQL